MSLFLRIAVVACSLLLAACEGADGADGVDGGSGAPGTDGSSGYNSLTTLTDEPAGLVCAHGGQRIDTGLDEDRDGVLDAAEIDQTSYVCSISAATVYATEYRGDLCLHGATLLKSGPDLDGDGVLDPVEVLSTATICQNNAGPSFWLRNAIAWNPEINYDAATRTFSMQVYDHAGADLYFVSDDANGDAVTITPDSMAGVVFDSFDPAEAYPDSDDPAHGAGSGLHLGLAGMGLAPGLYDIPVRVTDGEAETAYTVQIDVLAGGAHFLPYLAQEGVDEFAGGRITLNAPAPFPLHLRMEPQAYSPAVELEICLDGEDCEPMMVFFGEYCSGGPGEPGCENYYVPASIVIPAGTTGFDVRIPVADDASWGNNINLPVRLGLHDGDSSHVVAWIDDHFQVTDDDGTPGVSFAGAQYSMDSGDFVNVLIQSTLTDIFIPVLLTSTAGRDVDYFYTSDLVWIDGSGTGTLQIGTILDETMTVDYIINLAFDESFGLVPGAQPTATITVGPPPPLAISFLAAAGSVNRYVDEHCALIQLNRISYIASVDFEVTLTGGSAVDGEDYWGINGTGAQTLAPGTIEHPVCVYPTAEEQVADRTLEFTLGNVSGAAAGTHTVHTLTLEGAPWPTLGFAADNSDAMLDIAVDSDCVTVQASGTTPGNTLTEYALRVVAPDPLLETLLTSAGFSRSGDDWLLYDYFQGGVTDAGNQYCFTRPAEAVAGAGDYLLDIRIEAVGGAHADPSASDTGLSYRQAYGVRALRTPPQPFSSYNYTFLDHVVADNGAVAMFGYVAGCIPEGPCSGSYDLVMQYRDPAGALRWQRLYSENLYDQVVSSRGDELGNIYYLLEERLNNGVVFNRKLRSVDPDGNPRWEINWFPGRVLAVRNGIALASNETAGTVSAIDGSGAVSWTRTSADFGITGCTAPLHYEAVPASGGDWYVAAIPEYLDAACVIEDHDLDTQVHDLVIARLAANGNFTWRRDDTGGNPLQRTVLALRTDAAGALYLADQAQVVKMDSAGAVAWNTATPVPDVLPWSQRIDFDVTPAGASAGLWHMAEYTDFGGLPPFIASGADIGAWALDAAGNLVTTVRAGSTDYDDAYWLLASDDGVPLAGLYIGLPVGETGVFRLGAPDLVEGLLAGLSSEARPHRLADGNLLLVDPGLDQIRLRNPAFEPQ